MARGAGDVGVLDCADEQLKLLNVLNVLGVKGCQILYGRA